MKQKNAFYFIFYFICSDDKHEGGKEQGGMKIWYYKLWEFYFLNICNKKANIGPGQ